jgi:hypothetical protein
MTTGEKSEVQSPNYEVQTVRHPKFVNRHATARDAELADQQGIIVRRMLPINPAQPFRLLVALSALSHTMERLFCVASPMNTL